MTEFVVINKSSKSEMIVEDCCPARAVDQTIWRWEEVDVHILDVNGTERHLDGREVLHDYP